MFKTLSITERLDAIESRAAITDLLYGYAHAFDTHDVELLKSLFHLDGIVDLGPDFGKAQGQDAIGAAADKLWAKMPHMHHWITNPRIKLDGETASSTATILGVMFDKDDGPAQVAGTYSDVFARRDGRWAISSRQFEAHFWVPLKNWVPAAGTDLA